MTTTTTTTPRRRGWTPLAIFTMIMGFVLWWPLGLAVIGYILWGGSVDGLLDDAAAWAKARFNAKTAPQAPTTGNAAFDAYKAETLKRLEDEERAFSEYLAKLRDARDRDEFDRFVAERDNRG